MTPDALESGPPLLADTSAWHRADHPAVREQWIAAVVADRILTTPPVVVELLYSSRDGAELKAREADLSQFRSIPLTSSVAARRWPPSMASPPSARAPTAFRSPTC